jgi:hypothetical protein
MGLGLLSLFQLRLKSGDVFFDKFHFFDDSVKASTQYISKKCFLGVSDLVSTNVLVTLLGEELMSMLFD